MEKIILSEQEDIQGIIEMAKQIPEAAETLIGFEKDLPGWISQRHSLVAKTENGQIIGHQACDRWPISQWFELRTAMVLPEHRGVGLNTRMKLQMITMIKSIFNDAIFVGFTEPASKSRGILEKNRFTVLPMPEVPEEFFTVCENPGCWKKTGKDCGCRVYILKP